jgi:hypothetical protein
LRREILSREKKSNQPVMKTDRLLSSGFSSRFARFAPQTSARSIVAARVTGAGARIARSAIAARITGAGARVAGNSDVIDIVALITAAIAVIHTYTINTHMSAIIVSMWISP